MDYYDVEADKLASQYAKTMGSEAGIAVKSFLKGFEAALNTLETRKLKDLEKKEPIIYKFSTGMGRVNTYNGHPLTFLSATEQRQLDSIGYSGKTLEGVKTTKHDFFNSLDKGNFAIKQTVYDNGDFCESFILARTI